MSAQNLETLAKRYVELKSRIADLQEEADGLKAELMENREPGEYAAGPLTVKIKKGKRNLDAGAFEKHFPIQQYADCYQIKPKALSAIIKQVGENALQDCVKVGAASLVVERCASQSVRRLSTSRSTGRSTITTRRQIFSTAPTSSTCEMRGTWPLSSGPVSTRNTRKG